MSTLSGRAQNESGRVKIASVVLIVIIVAGVYAGIAFGSVYFRKMKLEEAVRQHISFAGQVDDVGITEQIRNSVIELGLPSAAQRVGLTRTNNPRALHVSIVYTEQVNLLVTTVEVPIRIQLSRGF